MRPLRESAGSSGLLARFTPDSHRWRRRIAGLAAAGSALSFYGAFAVASGVKSGMVYNLLVALFGLLALLLPVVATAVLLAPGSGLTSTDASRDEDAVETLKRRYAAGEMDREEFERRLDDLVAASGDFRDGANESVGNRTTPDAELAVEE